MTRLCDGCGRGRTGTPTHDYAGGNYCPDCIAVIETAGIVDPKLDARYERERAER